MTAPTASKWSHPMSLESSIRYRASATMQPSPMRTSMYRSMNRLLLDDCATISGIARTLILLWDRDLAVLPDRSFVGGFYFRFVDTGGQEGGAAR